MKPAGEQNDGLGLVRAPIGITPLNYTILEKS